LVSVAENGYYYSHNTTGKLASLFQKNHSNQSSIEKAILTPIEIDFLKLASTELTYKEIAKATDESLSPKTVVRSLITRWASGIASSNFRAWFNSTSRRFNSATSDNIAFCSVVS